MRVDYAPPLSSVSASALVDLRETLLSWFWENRRELPMRAEGVTPWGTLVGEVMSQQTPMPRVQPVWQRWIQLWPSPQALAKASPAEVLVEWGRLGYPSRALRLRECAIAIASRPDGQLPKTVEELCALPGIGPYTASALVSFQFNGRVAVLDTNIRRVLSRVFTGVERPSSASPSKAERALADSVLPEEGAACATWNVALMEFGALVCTQKNPGCSSCPLVEVCAWTRAGRPVSQVQPRRQAWAGTDRQARGRVVALLRQHHLLDASSRAGVSRERAVEAATLPGADPAQAPRVLSGLVADGLIVEGEDGVFRLPEA